MSTPGHACCFDASALVKVWVDEPDCGPARHYFNTQSPTKYTTPFCYFETLSAMKLKWLRGVITREVYLNAAFALTVWFQASARHVKDIDLTHPPTFLRAKEIVERYEVDLSDAFQILSLKEGYFSPLINDSKTLLVTADERLANAAKAEGLNAWYCMSWPMPK
ncbi:MAG: type II toxin-antitoxin system VapC family toxin [Pseudomonadota bacterium]